ncbi:MAG: MotE family protein [Thalassovita sp.]
MSKRSRRPPRVSRGSLSVIATLLIGSAALRIAAGGGEAWAKAEERFQAASAEQEVVPLVAPQVCETDEEYAAMLEAFDLRKRRLDEREASIDARMQALTQADRDIAVQLAELREAEDALSRTLQFADQASERDVGRLVTVYETMKPKDAAALFEEMEPNFAAGFLARMKPEAAAGVMTGLTPETAYTISVVLAGRNMGVPKE